LGISLRCDIVDDPGDIVQLARVVAGHAVHHGHAPDHAGRDLFFDGAFGEGVIDRRLLAVAMAAALDLLQLDGAVAHVV
jgi:hypothetical protein